MADLSEQIEDVAAGPKSVKADGVEVQAQDLKALIEADQYLASKSAASKPHRGIRLTKLVPPGAD